MSIGGSLAEQRSPVSKVKFMCSFGGKILPRTFDGVLKYVGGETRVIAVSPDITFSELTKKLTEITESDLVLKYQIIPEDLDALVSVKSDEDLKHMMEEYNRHETTPKLRTFLFPSKPIVLENQFGHMETQTIEQRYIEAINGIVRTQTTKKNVLFRAPIKTKPSFNVSACSSPKSESSPDNEQPEMGVQNNNIYQLNRLYPMHRVRSSPNISQQLQPQYNPYFQHPNYLTCRMRPQDFHRGRASSVPQSPTNHGLGL